MMPSADPVRCIERGSLIVNQDYLEMLDAFGLLDFQSVYGHPGCTIKDIADRWIARVELEWQGASRRFYFKRHRAEPMGVRAAARRRRGQRCSQGWQEFENILAFREQGIPTAVPVAAGERICGRRAVESFLITEAFQPFTSLEEIMADRPGALSGRQAARARALLIEKIAVLARKMHRAGFNHRDFNATHILVHYSREIREPVLALFDLQRVDRKKMSAWRWPVKTLARLNYSLPGTLFDDAERRQLLCAYRDRERFTALDHLQWLWIRRKTGRIARHTDRIAQRKAATLQHRGAE